MMSDVKQPHKHLDITNSKRIKDFDRLLVKTAI